MPVHIRPGLARLTFVVVLFAALCGLMAGSAAAGDDPAATPQVETEQIKVAAVLCNDWSCFEFGSRIDGFAITAVNLDTGEVLDSCVTDVSSPHEGCFLDIPLAVTWGLTFDDAQVPEGYVYHGSPIAVSGGAHGLVTYLPFHPLVDPEPGHSVVQAALCTDASCKEYVEFLDGFLISAVNPVTGQEYSECMTGNAQQGLDHQCILDVPAKGEVQYVWVDDQVPDGYVPFGKPIVAGDPAVTTIAFKPVDGGPATPVATEGPVTRLPVTGTSQAANGDNLIFAIALVGGVALAVFGVIQVRAAGTRQS